MSLAQSVRRGHKSTRLVPSATTRVSSNPGAVRCGSLSLHSQAKKPIVEDYRSLSVHAMQNEYQASGRPLVESMPDHLDTQSAHSTREREAR